jgi:hypothetical protein
MSSAPKPVEVFLSYAREDELLCKELEKHLSLLQRQGHITAYHDRLIALGTNWSQAIDAHLDAASIILLLISSDFLASDYRYGAEMQRALERERNGEAYVIPVLLRPVDFHNAPFAHLQCLPQNRRPVKSWSDLDEAFSDIARGIRQVVEHLHKTDRTLPLPPLPSWTANKQVPQLSRTNRQRMLRRVHTIWVKGILEQSLHRAALIELGLQEQPDAVANPWRLVLQEAKQPIRPLPAGTRITQVYDDTDGELLILGEPGAGKTTLLLELARDLLNRAEQDEAYPIPVVFHLSSWAVKQQPLAAWLVEELSAKYQLPPKVGQAWVDADELLLLLDGLDEVREAQRSACITTINAYRQEHDLVPVVVCSRKAEYLAQKVQIMLHSAVVVQPLSTQQIDDYLSSVGRQLEAVRVTLLADSGLQEMVKTPLMLSIVMLTYQGKPIGNLQKEGTAQTLQQQVFKTYIQRMLQRRGVQTRYTPQQTIHWLTILAQQMQYHNQSIFYLEHMQADWLDMKQKEIYQRVAVRMVSMLIGLLVTWIVALLYSNPFDVKGLVRPGLIAAFFGFIFVQSNLLPRLNGTASRWRSSWESAWNGALLVGLGTALVWGYTSDRGIFSLSANVLFGRFVAGFTTTCACLLTGLLIQGMAQLGKNSRYWYTILVGAVICFLFAIRSDWAYWWYYQNTNAGSFYGLTYALNEGLLYGFSGLLLSIILHKQDGTIRPTETISWSLQSLRQSLREKRHLQNTLFIALLTGLLRGLSVLISFGRSYDDLALLFTAITQPLIISESVISGVIFGLSFGLSYWLIIGLWNGVSQGVLNNLHRLRPNQGTRQSARNGLRMGLLVGCVGLLVIVLAIFFGGEIMSNDTSSSYLLYIGWNAALTSGLLGGLLAGGSAWLQHYTLRTLLWWKKLIPSDYIDFLDYAADHLLLRKVGGGYIFVHRLLLDYFASLKTKET